MNYQHIEVWLAINESFGSHIAVAGNLGHFYKNFEDDNLRIQ